MVLQNCRHPWLFAAILMLMSLQIDDAFATSPNAEHFRSSLTKDPATIHKANADQIEMVNEITDEVFRNRLADFLGRVFSEQGETLSTTQRLDIVEAAIQDCVWLEICGEGDVVVMAVLRLVAPDLVEDEAYREAVLEQIPNPIRRAGVYLGEVAFHMNRTDRTLFYGKVNYWWEFVKEDI